ncbi:MAG: 23S rRNA (pseudouridine(1915)-N(3))-methyltransferase RlmH [Polynucleobacter sp.]|jgi:23S rRNA (pseudouridine1915-N3)-methyltransferase|nr:23S rRNA (pseudouridine(1915)-N(3))-methyltransferase RlmH [Polynucleobacter sp.]NDH68871.1 23S rRNA (pseudouridine(1915)-N(3))-methyltransferase RlmH [Gammaproteobacteria bacterium]
MKLWVICVGHKMPEWVELISRDYLKRMPSDCAIELKEIKPDTNPAKEALKIIAAIPNGSFVIALDEHGKDISTQNIANELKIWRQNGHDVAFLIGGANGLDQSAKDTAKAIWRLSSLTLPHALARVLLIEQLYRAWTILQGHPYHRE